jgi:hypothetical protein
MTRHLEKNVMVDEVQTQPAPQATLTDAELRALAYFAVGVGSEGSVGGRDVSNRLAFAGTIRNGVMDPVGVSGYSIGTLQTDLGQHPETAMPLVDAYQVWARTNHPDWVLTGAQRIQTASDLGRDGDTIEAQNGRPLDATVKSHLDSFLVSDAGITFVHDRDTAQINRLMRPGGAMDQLQGTTLYQNSTLDDQAKLATVVLKLENQSDNRYYPRIINGINNGTIGGVEEAINMVDGFMPNRSGRNRDEPDYIESGMDHAQEGTEVFNSLRNADQRSPLHQPWQSVLANPLVNPTQTAQDAAHPNLSSEYVAIKNLFLQKGSAPALIEALDQGAAYGYNITNNRGQSRPQSTSLYASGNDFVVMDGRGIGKAYVGGAWSDVDRADITRANNRDGTVDLNINRAGVTQLLLHVDPNAPVLRPVQQPVDPAPAISTERQNQGSLIPSQIPTSTREHHDTDARLSQAHALADQPENPSFSDFERIRSTAHASGRWNEEESRNIAASLLKEHAADPLCKHLHNVAVGVPTAKGEVNVFGIYSPFGDQGPHFATHVDGNQASKEQAQPNLEQVEQIKQQTQELVQQQARQLNNASQHGPHHSV